MSDVHGGGASHCEYELYRGGWCHLCPCSHQKIQRVSPKSSLLCFSFIPVTRSNMTAPVLKSYTLILPFFQVMNTSLFQLSSDSFPFQKFLFHFAHLSCSLFLLSHLPSKSLKLGSALRRHLFHDAATKRGWGKSYLCVLPTTNVRFQPLIGPQNLVAVL